MLENVILAIITGLLAVLGTYVGNVTISRKKAREDALKDAERETKQALRLDIIEKKLDEHNKWGEKFTKVSEDIAVIKKELEYLRKENR